LQRKRRQETTISDDEESAEETPSKKRPTGSRPSDERQDGHDDDKHLIKNLVAATTPFVKMVFTSSDMSLLDLFEVDGASLEEVRTGSL
jgi:hypothetical protein